MIHDILIILVIEMSIKHVFSLFNRVIIVIWSQLSPEMIFDIMIYKNHLSWCKKELKFFDNTAIYLEEKEVALELNSKEIKILSKWKAEWWNNKKKWYWI